VDVDLSLEDDVEMVSRFALPDDDGAAIGDALSGVRSQPAKFLVGKPLKDFDPMQSRYSFRYRSRLHRRNGRPGYLVNFTGDTCMPHPMPSCLNAIASLDV
jgi:hypothetical protein